MSEPRITIQVFDREPEGRFAGQVPVKGVRTRDGVSFSTFHPDAAEAVAVVVKQLLIEPIPGLREDLARHLTVSVKGIEVTRSSLTSNNYTIESSCIVEVLVGASVEDVARAVERLAHQEGR